MTGLLPSVSVGGLGCWTQEEALMDPVQGKVPGSKVPLPLSLLPAPLDSAGLQQWLKSLFSLYFQSLDQHLYCLIGKHLLKKKKTKPSQGGKSELWLKTARFSTEKSYFDNANCSHFL